MAAGSGGARMTDQISPVDARPRAGLLNEQQYASFVKMMAAEAGIVSTASRRRGYEMTYFQHHKKRGVKLRGKYRP
jgi:hypothetical protein